MHAGYWDTQTDTPVATDVSSLDDVKLLCATVTALRTGRGVPTIELVHREGASLSLSFDGPRAFLVWIDSAGQSQSSVGAPGGADLVFDYFGSYSEAPDDAVIPLEQALVCVQQFLLNGTPVAGPVEFALD